MKKNIFISYSVRYKKQSEKQIKKLETAILNVMLQDADFCKKVLSERQIKSNTIKTKKIIKILILNLIRAINYESELIISLDKNTLSKNNVSLKLYSGILDKLERMDLIEVHKGFFLAEDRAGKRSRISAKDRLKNLIIKNIIEYTENVFATLVRANKVKVGDLEKVKLTFKAVDSDLTWSCFKDISVLQKWITDYGKKGLKDKKIKLKLNGTRIVDIDIN